MPLAKLTCPHCRATLKPAKPVSAGKTVKCPKCGETFKAGAGVDDPGAAGRPKAEAPAKKPAAAAAKPAEEPEEEAIYGVVKDEAEERKRAEEEERLRRRKRRQRARARGEEIDEDDEDDEKEDALTEHYLGTLKTKDPRGPAQETVVGPANWLLRTALVGFFGWVFYFIAFMLPIAFPTYDKAEDEYSKFAKTVKEEGDKKASSSDKAIIHWWSAESILHGGDPKQPEMAAWSILLFLFVMVVGLAQAAVLAIASTKMTALESYKWAVWGCALAIIPLMIVPWWVLFIATLDLLDSILELGETTWMYASVLFLWGPIVGGLCLKQILQKHVRPGFEYKPD